MGSFPLNFQTNPGKANQIPVFRLVIETLEVTDRFRIQKWLLLGSPASENSVKQAKATDPRTGFHSARLRSCGVFSMSLRSASNMCDGFFRNWLNVSKFSAPKIGFYQIKRAWPAILCNLVRPSVHIITIKINLHLYHILIHTNK